MNPLEPKRLDERYVEFNPSAPSDTAPGADIEPPRIDTGAGGGLSPADDQLLTELAGLSLIEYDRRREDAATELGGIRVSTLDQEISRRRPRDAPADDGAGSTLLFEEYDPWPEPVNGGELLDRLRSTVERYAIMPAGGEIAIPLWVLFAHTHNHHSVSPILAILAPDSECGKTTLLNTVSWLVPKALPSSGASPATVYRVIEDCQPTLLTDELDSLTRETADALRGIYNSGHVRRLAYIMRMVKAGDDMEVRRFSTWGPKAIAQIGKPATTILSRSIVIWMQRKKPGQDIEKLPVVGTAELVDLHRRCLRWAGDHGQHYWTPFRNCRRAWATDSLTTGRRCLRSPISSVALGRRKHATPPRSCPVLARTTRARVSRSSGTFGRSLVSGSPTE